MLSTVLCVWEREREWGMYMCIHELRMVRVNQQYLLQELQLMRALMICDIIFHMDDTAKMVQNTTNTGEQGRYYKWHKVQAVLHLIPSINN